MRPARLALVCLALGCTAVEELASPIPDEGPLDADVADAVVDAALPSVDAAVMVDATRDQTLADAAPPADAGPMDAAPPPDAALPPPACETTGEHPLRRLSPVQYRATARAFGLPDLPLDLTGDVAPAISQLATEKRLLAAAELADAAELEPGGLLPCDPALDADACAVQTRFEWADRLFRRPPTPAELDWLAAVWDAAPGDFIPRARLLLEVLLASPQFLYRLEPVAEDAAARAARLAYTLTDAPPDDPLRAADLADPVVLQAEAARLAASATGQAKLRRFLVAWAGLADIGHKVAEFPRAAAIAESVRFIDAIVAADGRFADLMTARTAALDDAVAPLYGVAADVAELPVDERAGLLTRVAFLAAHAGPVAKSPIQRGVFVREQLLCSPLPPPPPTVDDSPVTRGSSSDDGQPRSIRELTERRTGGGQCTACHQVINPPGFLFGHYDARGRYVIEEEGVDASGEPYRVPVESEAFVPGSALPVPLADAVALSAAVAEDALVLDCVAAQWLAHAWDRPLEPADACDLERLQAAFRASGGRLSVLLTATAELDGMAR